MAARKTNRLSPKTCKQIADLVSDYLNGTLSSRVKRDLDTHLSRCPDCVAFLNTYRETVTATNAIRAEAMPGAVRRNFLAFLHKRARGKRAST